MLVRPAPDGAPSRGLIELVDKDSEFSALIAV